MLEEFFGDSSVRRWFFSTVIVSSSPQSRVLVTYYRQINQFQFMSASRSHFLKWSIFFFSFSNKKINKCAAAEWGCYNSWHLCTDDFSNNESTLAYFLHDAFTLCSFGRHFSTKSHLDFSGFSSKQAAIIYENTKKESSSANIKREVRMADSKH